jgi:mannose-6-phosphate isomerase-like protein (cupin superfamily)
MTHIIRRIDDVIGKKVAPGVIERTAISPEETASKALTVTHAVIEPGCKYGPLQTGAGEAFAYCISGHADLIYKGIYAPQLFTLCDFEGGRFSLIPPARDYYFLCRGEGPLRVLVVHYKLPKMQPKGMVELFNKDMPPRTDYIPGSISRVILPPEVLRVKGMEMFSNIEHETDAPKHTVVWTPSPKAERVDYFIRGHAKFTVADKRFEVGPGTVVYGGPPPEKRVQENSDDDVLVYLCILGLLQPW